MSHYLNEKDLYSDSKLNYIGNYFKKLNYNETGSWKDVIRAVKLRSPNAIPYAERINDGKLHANR